MDSILKESKIKAEKIWIKKRSEPDSSFVEVQVKKSNYTKIRSLEEYSQFREAGSSRLKEYLLNQSLEIKLFMKDEDYSRADMTKVLEIETDDKMRGKATIRYLPYADTNSEATYYHVPCFIKYLKCGGGLLEVILLDDGPIEKKTA